MNKCSEVQKMIPPCHSPMQFSTEVNCLCESQIWDL